MVSSSDIAVALAGTSASSLETGIAQTARELNLPPSVVRRGIPNETMLREWVASFIERALNSAIRISPDDPHRERLQAPVMDLMDVIRHPNLSKEDLKASIRSMRDSTMDGNRPEDDNPFGLVHVVSYWISGAIGGRSESGWDGSGPRYCVTAAFKYAKRLNIHPTNVDQAMFKLVSDGWIRY